MIRVSGDGITEAIIFLAYNLPLSDDHRNHDFEKSDLRYNALNLFTKKRM